MYYNLAPLAFAITGLLAKWHNRWLKTFRNFKSRNLCGYLIWIIAGNDVGNADTLTILQLKEGATRLDIKLGVTHIAAPSCIQFASRANLKVMKSPKVDRKLACSNICAFICKHSVSNILEHSATPANEQVEGSWWTISVKTFSTKQNETLFAPYFAALSTICSMSANAFSASCVVVSWALEEYILSTSAVNMNWIVLHMRVLDNLSFEFPWEAERTIVARSDGRWFSLLNAS